MSGPPSSSITSKRMCSTFFFLREGVSFRSRMISPPRIHRLSMCLRCVFRDRLDEDRCSMNGRKQATSFSPGGRSLSQPIHERGQFSKSASYGDRSSCETGGAWSMVEGFPVEILFAMDIVIILNRCCRFRGFVYQSTRLVRDNNTLEVVVRPRRG